MITNLIVAGMLCLNMPQEKVYMITASVPIKVEARRRGGKGMRGRRRGGSGLR